MSGTPALVPVMRTADLRRVEAAARGEPLMERAGLAAAEVARAMAGDRGGGITVLAGPGNNGGDAFVTARWLRRWFFDPVVVFRGDPERLPPDAAAARRAYVGDGGRTAREAPSHVRDRLIVDGLFGIGLTRTLSPEYAALVERANAAGAPILALDVPTGIDADTGIAYGAAIRAEATATFLALKPGLVMGDGVDCAGTVSVHALGVDVEATAPRGHRLDWPVLADALPDVLRRRVRNVHKGTFGTLGIVGGAPGMVGAPLLAGRAALHAGAGKVWIGFAAREHPAVDWAQPELMLRPAARVLGAGADALVCGPGLGTDDTAAELVARALAEPVPLVVDADALTLLAARSDLASAIAARAAPTIATPHPAEAGRLLARSVADVQADRIAAALAIADKLRASVVLKGAGSVLAHPDGRWDVNASGNPALASAGTGDVLAGFAGAFLAQRIEPVMALRLAVCLHGAAADA
ncbi:MAG TPA: NAD(P)H-hydrate dehydratase, partial [Casimicrobiaceae bacterium]|nr:NAD(P)H-hydrate dehydratase [Casimicrobiaceae bacterium]